MSQQKHLICPASQRLPAVIVQPTLYCHPAYITALSSDPHITIPLLSHNSSLIWCAAFTVVADPVRRPSTSIHPPS